MSPTPKRPTKNVKQAARFLGIHPQTLLKYIHDGRVVAVRVGRRFEIHQDRLNDFLKGERNGKRRTSK